MPHPPPSCVSGSQVEPPQATVGADIGHQLSRLVLEAAANAAKHSRAFRLSIRVRIEADEILLSVGNDRSVAPELATIAFVPRMLCARLDRLRGTMRVRPGRRHRGQRSRGRPVRSR